VQGIARGRWAINGKGRAPSRVGKSGVASREPLEPQRPQPDRRRRRSGDSPECRPSTARVKMAVFCLIGPRFACGGAVGLAIVSGQDMQAKRCAWTQY